MLNVECVGWWIHEIWAIKIVENEKKNMVLNSKTWYGKKKKQSLTFLN